MKEDDFYIKALRFAANRQVTGFPIEEFTEWIGLEFGGMTPALDLIQKKL